MQRTVLYMKAESRMKAERAGRKRRAVDVMKTEWSHETKDREDAAAQRNILDDISKESRGSSSISSS